MVLGSIITMFADPEIVYRFQAVIDGVYLAAFTEFQMPDLTLETMDVKEGGQNTYTHKLPVALNTGPAVLKQGITSDLSLLEWYMQVVNGDIGNAKRQVTVIMQSAMGIPVLGFNFRDAYPIKWVAPSLNTEQNSVGFEELHFVHHGFTIGNLMQEYTTVSG